MSRQGLGLAGVAAGLVAVAVIQLVAPLAEPPLYDGVVVIEPYRFLAPGPGQRGSPLSSAEHDRVSGGRNPLIAVATAENPPQAQIFAPAGSLTLPSGSTELAVRIMAIPAPAPVPADRHILGNVYAIDVTNQAGAAVTASARGLVSVVLRAPSAVGDTTMLEYSAGSWHPLATIPEVSNLFLVQVTGFGDFALTASGPPRSPPPSGTGRAPGSFGVGGSASAVPGFQSPTGSSSPVTGLVPAGASPPPSTPTSGAPPAPFVAIAGVAIVLVVVGAGALVLRRQSRG